MADLHASDVGSLPADKDLGEDFSGKPSDEHLARVAAAEVTLALADFIGKNISVGPAGFITQGLRGNLFIKSSDLAEQPRMG